MKIIKTSTKKWLFKKINDTSEIYYVRSQVTYESGKTSDPVWTTGYVNDEGRVCGWGDVVVDDKLEELLEKEFLGQELVW